MENPIKKDKTLNKYILFAKIVTQENPKSQPEENKEKDVNLLKNYISHKKEKE